MGSFLSFYEFMIAYGVGFIAIVILSTSKDKYVPLILYVLSGWLIYDLKYLEVSPEELTSMPSFLIPEDLPNNVFDIFFLFLLVVGVLIYSNLKNLKKDKRKGNKTAYFLWILCLGLGIYYMYQQKYSVDSLLILTFIGACAAFFENANPLEFLSSEEETHEEQLEKNILKEETVELPLEQQDLLSEIEENWKEGELSEVEYLFYSASIHKEGGGSKSAIKLFTEVIGILEEKEKLLEEQEEDLSEEEENIITLAYSKRAKIKADKGERVGAIEDYRKAMLFAKDGEKYKEKIALVEQQKSVKSNTIGTDKEVIEIEEVNIFFLIGFFVFGVVVLLGVGVFFLEDNRISKFRPLVMSSEKADANKLIEKIKNTYGTIDQQKDTTNITLRLQPKAHLCLQYKGYTLTMKNTSKTTISYEVESAQLVASFNDKNRSNVFYVSTEDVVLFNYVDATGINRQINSSKLLNYSEEGKWLTDKLTLFWSDGDFEYNKGMMRVGGRRRNK